MLSVYLPMVDFPRNRSRHKRGDMARFEYMICASQLMRVTFVNGRWQGDLSPETPGALDTCPDLWEFLQRVGNSRWELIAVTSDKMAGVVTSDKISGEEGVLTTLYLKREKA